MFEVEFLCCPEPHLPPQTSVTACLTSSASETHLDSALLEKDKSRHVPFYHFSSINTCHSKGTKTRQYWPVKWHHCSPTVIYKTTIFIVMLEFYITGRKWNYCSLGEIGAQSVPVTWAHTSGVAATGRSYRLSLSHFQGELGVLCQTSHLLDGGASLEAAWAEETHTHTQPVKNSSTVTSVC